MDFRPSKASALRNILIQEKERRKRWTFDQLSKLENKEELSPRMAQIAEWLNEDLRQLEKLDVIKFFTTN